MFKLSLSLFIHEFSLRILSSLNSLDNLNTDNVLPHSNWRDRTFELHKYLDLLDLTTRWPVCLWLGLCQDSVLAIIIIHRYHSIWSRWIWSSRVCLYSFTGSIFSFVCSFLSHPSMNDAAFLIYTSYACYFHLDTSFLYQLH